MAPQDGTVTELRYNARLRTKITAAAHALKCVPWLTPDHRVTLEQDYSERGDFKINVHTVQPEQLEQALREFSGATGHRDTDEILRWVSAKLDGLEFTFFRR